MGPTYQVLLQNAQLHLKGLQSDLETAFQRMSKMTLLRLVIGTRFSHSVHSWDFKGLGRTTSARRQGTRERISTNPFLERLTEIIGCNNHFQSFGSL